MSNYRFEERMVNVVTCDDAEKITWSPVPRQHYTVKIEEGNLFGLGNHPLFDVVPGAWNLMWLSYEPIDDLLSYAGDPWEFPYEPAMLAYVVGSCLQYSTAGVKFGLMAERCTPLQFLAFLKEYMRKDQPILLLRIFGKSWNELALQRAKLYQQTLNKFVQTNTTEIVQ